MAQSQSDVFSFLITPEFDTKSVTDSGKYLEQEVKEIAEKISNQVSEVMGKSFSFPTNFKKDDINDVTKLIESLGGSVKRTGEYITSSFKDANGTTVTLKQNLKDAIDVAEAESLKAAKNIQEVINIRKEFEQLRTSTSTYSSSTQTAQQNELEQQIIKSIQEQYSLEKKISEAKASNNTINETYYTGLQNIAKQEEANYQASYKGSQTRIDAIRSELQADQDLYDKKIGHQTAVNKATQQAKANNQELVSSIKEYVKQYQDLQSLESKGKQGTQAYKETQAAMQSLIQTLKQYGIEVQTNNNGTQQFVIVQKSAENQVDNVTKALRNGNVSLSEHTGSQNKLITSIQQSVENFVKYQVAMEAINKLTSEFTSAIYDMNEAMTQVRMVTMGSYEDTVQLADSYTQLAKQLGTTTTTVAEGADAWLRQGYSAQDAMEMLKQSTTLAVVGQLDAQESTDQLTAITKSYNVAVEDTSKIVDKLVAVDLQYAANCYFLNKGRVYSDIYNNKPL